MHKSTVRTFFLKGEFLLILQPKVWYLNIERHTAHTIVSWPNPKQWIIVHTSDLMMMIRQSIYILSIITREMGKLKTHSPTYSIMDNWENMLNLTHTVDKIYDIGYVVVRPNMLTRIKGFAPYYILLKVFFNWEHVMEMSTWRLFKHGDRLCIR